MSLLRPTRSPKVWRVRAWEQLDSDGDPVRDWKNPQWTEVKRATVQASSSTDEAASTPSAQDTEVQLRLFIPYAFDLQASDRVLVGDEVYRVDGRPVVRQGLSQSAYTRAQLVLHTDY